jgi:hypothetical protein
VRVFASGNVPKNCDMMEPFQVGGDAGQPVRGKLFDDAPVLRKTLERLHSNSVKLWDANLLCITSQQHFGN